MKNRIASTRPRRFVRALLGLGLLLAAVPVAAGGKDPLDVSQAAIGNRISDLELITTEGERLNLAELSGRPLGISLIYTACVHSCSVTTRYLDRVVKKARHSLGDEAFTMLSVGFDFPEDSPEAMAHYAHRHGVSDPNWHFAVAADQNELNRLIDELGFVYEPSPRGFDHTVQVSLIDRDGMLYRQVYGETFDAPLLVEPLKDLVLRRPASDESLMGYIGKRIRFFCTVYDARADRYYFNYSIFMGLIAGGLFLVGVAAWLASELLRRRRRA
ncbi:MAG TPA: SCO family protein [Wenzhouxiangella sp.]|nr:SCO family protein [Wenzhouxiangella sp.]